MAKYNWTIDDITERFHECVNLWANEQDQNLKTLYFMTAKALKTYLDNKIQSPNLPLLSLYNFEKDNLQSINFLWPHIQEFSHINDQTISNVPLLKKVSLNPKDILTLTHDFYKSLNPFFFGNFMQNFYRKNDHICFLPQNDKSNIDGQTLFIPHRNEAFIEIFRCYTLNDVLTTFHEYGHATSYTINYLNRFDMHYLYNEIITLFLELIGADFLETQFGQNTATTLKAINHNTMIELGKITTNKIELIEAENILSNGYSKNKDLKRIARELLNLDSAKTEDLFNEENLEIVDYNIGYIIAIELYYIFLEDKDKALFILKKLLLQNAKSELEYFQNIKKLGIIPNLHTQDYYEYLQNEVLKLTQKKSKH